MPQTHRPLTVAALLLSMFMGALEATVIATAMPTVVADLHGIELYGWVGAIYMLATTVTIPIWGKLADMRGRKPVMLLGLATFLAGSMASGMAGSMVQLIVFRALQGAGAGAIQPVALTIVGDLFTMEQRAKMQGLFGAVWGIAGIMGPLLGGLIVRELSWRWVFYLNLPLGAAAAAILIACFHEAPRDAKQRPPIDGLGAILLSVSILSLLAAAGGRSLPVTLPVMFASLLALWLVERRAASPVVPTALLRIPTIAIASACGTLMGAVMTGSVMYAPLFVQAVRGGSATEGGVAVAPMLIGWPVASALSGRLLPRFGARVLVRIGLAVLAVSAVVLCIVLSTGANSAALRVTMLVFGAGMGFANTPLLISVQSAVPWEQRGAATATTMFSRSIGGSIAVGALGAMLARAVARDVPDGVLESLLGPQRGRNLPADLIAGYATAIEKGMLPLFVTIAVLGVLAALVGWFFPKPRTAPA